MISSLQSYTYKLRLRRVLTTLVVAFLFLQAAAPALPLTAPRAAAAQVEEPQALQYNSLSLAGADGYIGVPYSAELNTLSAITIEAWVYRNNTNRNETLVGNGWEDSYWVGFSPTGKLRFIPNGGGYVDSNATVTTGKWTHMAVTYNGQIRNFYINGALDKTSNLSPGPIPGNPGTELGIGFDSDPFTGNYFDGVIDEVRIWNAVRTPADIQAGMFQAFSTPLPTSLIGYWRLDGDATDETGDHDGTPHGGLGAMSWVNDGGLPKDIRIPQVGNAPNLDGLCNPTEYANAISVSVEGKIVTLQHTATDLWVCFDFYLNSDYTRARLLLDPTHDRLDPAQTDDIRLEVQNDDTLVAYAGNDAGSWVITDTYDTLWDGDWHVSGGEFPMYTAEFRVDSSVVGGWGHLIGLALDPYIPGFQGFDLAGIWPALAVGTLPSTWSSATLAGTGPTRTFSGSVQYQPKNLAYDPTSIGGAKIELYGYDVGGIQALVANATTGPGGTFSLNTNDDFTQHRLELLSYPPGYTSKEAEAPLPGIVLDSRTIDYGTAGGGTYPGNIFTLGDQIPQNTNAPYGPVFLIIAPQAVIDGDALDDFVTFKIQQGYAVSTRSVEQADTYPGATRLERIRAMEQDFLGDYGSRFQFVMLVGGDDIIPFAKITPYATGEGSVCPSESPKNYKYSDWLYVDLTSNFDSNNNGCYADGALQSADKLVSGYIRDTGIAFDPTVVVGRMPFSDPNTIRSALLNSIGFEKQTESFKLKALNGMSMVALKGYFEGEACSDNWGDHCVSPVPNNQSNYDTSLLSEEMKNDFLNVNGFATTILYENEETVAGGQGYISPVDLTNANIRDTLDDGRFGLATMSGHGNSTGVYRNFWSSDKNSNGVVDVRDDSQTELSEVTFFDISGVLDQIGPDGSRGSVFVLLACSNASPTNASNLAATILSDGHGPASVAALSVVTVGNWFNESNGNVESIGYYVNKRLVSYSYRLGEALWWTLADLVHDGNSGSGGVAYDLYGDPTLSFYGNPGGQATLAAWPMSRRDPGGASYLTLPGPVYPTKMWEYTAGTHSSYAHGPVALVSNNGEVIVASGQYVDVLRQGVLFQRLNLDASVYGNPALSADGTIYVMDANADLYAFPYKRLTLNGHTYMSNERTRRWKVDLGENPSASPIVGSDGFILAGVGGPYASDPRLWLVRPDGQDFSSFALDHNPLYFAATDASRTAYVATSRVNEGHLYRFTQFCDTFVYPDVCPYPFWDEMTIDEAFNTPPLLAYGSLYIGDVVGNLYKINPGTLDIQATYNAGSAIKTGPTTAPGGRIIFTTGSGLYSLTSSLGLVWSKAISTYNDSIPAASSNAIYLAHDGYLWAYNPSSGAVLWKRSLGGETGPASVSVGYGREVFVQGVDGTVMAFSEGWGIRPARITAIADLISIRPVINLEILQSLPPISGTLSLTPDPLPVGEGEEAGNATLAGGDVDGAMAPAATVVGVLLQRSEDGGPWMDLVILDPGVTSYVDTNIQPNVSYAYRVQNLMSDGKNSEFETTQDVVQSYPDLPAAPTLNAVQVDGAETLSLSWTPAADSVVDHFVIERSLSGGGPFTPVITLTGETLAVQDTGLTPGTTYYYQVRALNGTGSSGPSNVASAATRSQALPAPQNFQAALNGKTEIQLSWDAGPAGATAVFEIITFGEVGYSLLGSVPATDGAYSFFTGEPGAYDFRIKFVQDDAESVYAYSAASLVLYETQHIYLPVIQR